MPTAVLPLIAAAIATLTASAPLAERPTNTARPRNAYRQVNLVSNLPELNPQIVDPLLKNAWGIAIRPPGAGGHFWLNNEVTGTSTTYVGDVPGVPLYQDDLLLVNVPNTYAYHTQPEAHSRPTGIVYTGWSNTEFMVTGEGITGPSKFIFVGLEGSISGWTTGQQSSVTMFDWSVEGSMFSGCALTEKPSGNRLYVADFGLYKVHVFDHLWNPVQVAGDFRDPNVPRVFFEIYNLQYLDGKLFATWGYVDDDQGEVEAYPGYGYVSEFDTEGRWIATYEWGTFLNAPWGLAIAPENFGAMSGMLLVGNFGDGTILAFDRKTRRFVDYLRDEQGEPIAIDGLWGVLFGNGVRLGHTNHLYFGAGPNTEEDGLFGKLVPVTP